MVLNYIWESSYQHCYRSDSGKSLAGGSIQFSFGVIGYVQFVLAFDLLISLVEVYLAACNLCSAEYGPWVGGYLERNLYSLLFNCSLLFVFFHAVPISII